ncbi:unnamed protein product [Effrenium voratum]|nr:unnamed protein product [Effrenium voratum]
MTESQGASGLVKLLKRRWPQVLFFFRLASQAVALCCFCGFSSLGEESQLRTTLDPSLPVTGAATCWIMFLTMQIEEELKQRQQSLTCERQEAGAKGVSSNWSKATKHPTFLG